MNKKLTLYIFLIMGISPVAAAADVGWRFAFKTNIVSDVLLIPEAGCEVAFGKCFSMGADFKGTKLKSTAKQWHHQAYGGDTYLRWWFGKLSSGKKLSGHHLGLYGQILAYDFAISGKGQMADKPNYAFGVEYGYSFPLLKSLNLDLSINMGYAGGVYETYEMKDNCKVAESTIRREWLGPTDVKLSLVWILGGSDYPKSGK